MRPLLAWPTCPLRLGSLLRPRGPGSRPVRLLYSPFSGLLFPGLRRPRLWFGCRPCQTHATRQSPSPTPRTFERVLRPTALRLPPIAPPPRSVPLHSRRNPQVARRSAGYTPTSYRATRTRAAAVGYGLNAHGELPGPIQCLHRCLKGPPMPNRTGGGGGARSRGRSGLVVTVRRLVPKAPTRSPPAPCHWRPHARAAGLGRLSAPETCRARPTD